MSKKVTISGRDYRGYSRKLDRSIARKNMKDRGYVKINKNNTFANNWRDFVNV